MNTHDELNPPPQQLWKTPKAALEALKEVGRHKATETFDQIFILSVMAGIYIALGGYTALLVGGNVPEVKHDNPGIQKLLYGATFATGLMYVQFTGAHLFTGNMFAIPLWLYSKRTNASSVGHGFKGIVFCGLGNFVGALGVGYLLVYQVNYDSHEPWVDYLKALCHKKVSRPLLPVFLASIGCNVVVATAVYMFACAQDAIGKFFSCFFPITAFGIMGFEHVVANMFYLPTGYFFGAEISIWQMFVWNLIPVTIGNLLGGAVVIAVPFWYAHIWRSNHPDAIEKVINKVKARIRRQPAADDSAARTPLESDNEMNNRT